MLISAGMTSLDLSCYCVQGEKPLSISCSMLANQGLQGLQEHLRLRREKRGQRSFNELEESKSA